MISETGAEVNTASLQNKEVNAKEPEVVLWEPLQSWWLFRQSGKNQQEGGRKRQAVIRPSFWEGRTFQTVFTKPGMKFVFSGLLVDPVGTPVLLTPADPGSVLHPLCPGATSLKWLFKESLVDLIH